MLKAVEKIVALAEEKNITFPEAVLLLDSKESGISVEEIRARMAERLADMRRSVREACANTIPCRIEEPMGAKLRAHGGGMAGEFIAAASATAMEVASYNAVMGRIVAAPTAGSCGIIPGMIFAWEFFRGEGKDTDELLTGALITAGAVGEVTAFRATLEEAANADLLLLVLDSADKDPCATLDVVLETLEGLGAGELPRLVILNKIDKSGAAAYETAIELRARGERVVCVCAIDGRGFGEMLSEIGEIFAGGVAQTGAEDIL